MPKIPTFTAKGRPTAEVGSIKSNIKLIQEVLWQHH